MLSIWIFLAIVAVSGIAGQSCQNITRYNSCGQSLNSSISSVTSDYALPFEAEYYICGNGTDTVKCFLEGLQACETSNITFKLEFAEKQWNASLIKEFLNSGCQTAGAKAFMSNYECMRTAVYSQSFKVCMDQAIARNPVGSDSIISCGLQNTSSICLATVINGLSCANQSALDFMVKWSYIKGTFEYGCNSTSRYDICAKNLKSSIDSVTNYFALPFEAEVYICGNGTNTVTCFLEGLQSYPNITFRSEFTQQQWNISVIKTLLDSGCPSNEAKAFLSNYACMRQAMYSPNFTMCMNQSLAANPMGDNNLISCGLQSAISSCMTQHIKSFICYNQTALDFFLKWYYVKGNFASDCNGPTSGGIEPHMIASTFGSVGVLFIFLKLIL